MKRMLAFVLAMTFLMSGLTTVWAAENPLDEMPSQKVGKTSLQRDDAWKWVYFGSSPIFGSASNYNKLIDTHNYSYYSQAIIGALTQAALGSLIAPQLVGGTVIFTVIGSLPSFLASAGFSLAGSMLATGGISFLNQHNIYYTRKVYSSSQYQDCRKVVITTYQNSARTIQIGSPVTYYIIYENI